MIFMGFFSCGYQLAFIAAHFPAFVAKSCALIDPGSMLAGTGITSTSILGTVAMSVIGLFNIAGSITAGWLGKRYSKKYLLAGIYVGRTSAAAAFIMTPMPPMEAVGGRACLTKAGGFHIPLAAQACAALFAENLPLEDFPGAHRPCGIFMSK